MPQADLATLDRPPTAPAPESADPTVRRKASHVALCLNEDVGFQRKPTGLERYDLRHRAVPELDLASVDPATTFLGKPLRAPLMVSCMTGGYAGGTDINRELAAFAERHGLAFGVGSQRQALENADHHDSFAVVREVAPTVPVVGNLGAAEVARGVSLDALRRVLDLVGADALAVHLNAVQELVQPEGTPSFAGVLRGIERLARQLGRPIIAKETGAGIDGASARLLLDAGVTAIDVAGAGGTSWAAVEALRVPTEDETFARAFWDWGVPTADCLVEVNALRSERAPFTLIASGGVKTGTESAIAIGLGADLVAIARPLLKVLLTDGPAGLDDAFRAWEREFRACLFLTGCRTPADLRAASPIRPR